MKVIAFSDIHGNQYALRQFLRDIKEVEYDCLFFCGDMHGYYYGQHEIAEAFRKMDNLYAVKGNHDKIAIDIAYGNDNAEKYFAQYGHSYAMLDETAIEYVSELPEVLEIELGIKKIAIIHGTFENVLNGRMYPKDPLVCKEEYRKYDYVFCGHTHFRDIRRTGNTTIINPGSLGQQRDGRGFGYAYVDTDDGDVRFFNISYDMSELEKDIKSYDPDNNKLIDILHRGE